MCTQCVAKAKVILTEEIELWVTTNYIAVTQTAEEVGMGFDIVGAPVALSRDVWNEYVKWTDQDSELQEYQEQDARLWDVLFTGGGTLQIKINQFLTRGFHSYSVVCIPRDGTSGEAIKATLLIRKAEIRGTGLACNRKGRKDSSSGRLSIVTEPILIQINLDV